MKDKVGQELVLGSKVAFGSYNGTAETRVGVVLKLVPGVLDHAVVRLNKRMVKRRASELVVYEQPPEAQRVAA